MIHREPAGPSRAACAGPGAGRRGRAGSYAFLGGGVVACAGLVAACHLVVPYAASAFDAAPDRALDGGLGSDAQAIAAVDGWVFADAGGDASARGTGCSAGVAERRIDEAMVVCHVGGAGREVDQCHAESLCNQGRGWRLCAPLDYARRFAARRPPLIGGWIGGCIYDLSARPYAFLLQGACPHCADTVLGEAITLARACRPDPKDDNHADSKAKPYRIAAKSVGFISGDSCATMLPSLSAGQTDAYWLPAAADTPRADAYCCLPDQ